MLWYKAWLETRWRFVFVIGSGLLALFGPGLLATVPPRTMWVALALGSSLIYCFAAIYLAGSGINSQTFYGVTSGYHASMLFTLSLPVSRRRLFLVRAALGAAEMIVVIAVVTPFVLARSLAPVSPLYALSYMLRASLCVMAVYALAALLACLLDEAWQFMGSCLLLGAFFLLQLRSSVVSQLSPLRGMSPFSFPPAGPAPWPAMLASLLVTCVLIAASLWVVQRKEY